MQTIRIVLFAAAIMVAAVACKTTEPAEAPDDSPAEPVEPETPAEPIEPAEPAEPEEPEPPPKPEPPKKKEAFAPYTGTAIIAAEAERKALACQTDMKANDLTANRKACIADLAQQIDPPAVILVTQEVVGRGCATCVSMTAEGSPMAGEATNTEVLFMGETAGTVECHSSPETKKLDEARSECLATLRKQSSSIRADVVFPLSIEEGEACPACVSIVGTGYTAKTLNQ